MRKFNLKGNVAKKLMGLERSMPEPAKAPVASSTPNTLRNQESTEIPETQETPVSAAVQPVALRVAWRTDVGRVRKNNQDAVILGNGLAGVADGMGGHRGGEIASAGCRDILLREIAGKTPDETALEQAVQCANTELWWQQERDDALSGMGTTLTACWPAETDMLVAQVGDSRAYLLRCGELKQITHDHSMVADLVSKGLITEEQAACHPMRNYITRAIGTDSTLDVDLYRVPRQRGDRWLICSDGLYGLLTREELASMMGQSNLEEAANQMLETALEHGGRDNISLVLLEDDGDHLPDDADGGEVIS